MSSAHLKRFSTVKPAKIEWREDLPYNLEFDDVYFSSDGGLAESRHVFIEGNQLDNDWQTKPQAAFYIAELGFGSGLNFLATAQHWQKSRAQNDSLTHKRLHYISIEKHPFSYDDLCRACEHWPELSELAEQLLRNYPSPTYGRHQIYFESSNLTLTLIFMPVAEALVDLNEESAGGQGKIVFDHWFLDGFGPTKNPSMWDESLIAAIANLSTIGTRLATFSVAASVKKPLMRQGFKLKKCKGFGRKREMLTAILTVRNSDELHTRSRLHTHSEFQAHCYAESLPSFKETVKYINLARDTPWFNYRTVILQPNYNKRTFPLVERKPAIAIIGAGIAGCATAYCLNQRGYQIHLFDSGESIAAGASGAAAGIFHPQLTSDMNINSQFNWLAYLMLLRFLASLSQEEQETIFVSRELTRLLPSEKNRNQLLRLAEILKLSNWIKPSTREKVECYAIDYPHAGAINLKAFCRLLLNKISADDKKIRLNAKVESLHYKNQQWQFDVNSLQYRYDQVVFCGGARSELLSQIIQFPTNITRGQTCLLEYPPIYQRLDNPICASNYLVPQKDGSILLGSTFDPAATHESSSNKHNPIESKPDEANAVELDSKNLNPDELNLDELNLDELNPDSQTQLLQEASVLCQTLGIPFISEFERKKLPLSGQVGYRLHSQDRLPLVGGSVDEKKVDQDFFDLGQRRIRYSQDASYNLPGLWLNTAYGSYGLLYSLLSANHLTSCITSDISPLPYPVAKAIHPARFSIKALKQPKGT